MQIIQVLPPFIQAGTFIKLFSKKGHQRTLLTAHTGYCTLGGDIDGAALPVEKALDPKPPSAPKASSKELPPNEVETSAAGLDVEDP